MQIGKPIAIKITNPNGLMPRIGTMHRALPVMGYKPMFDLGEGAFPVRYIMGYEAEPIKCPRCVGRHETDLIDGQIVCPICGVVEVVA